MKLTQALEQTVSDLIVDHGYRPLSQAFPPAEPAEALFDNCLARIQGDDVRVLGFLLWREQEAREIAARALQLRAYLEASGTWISGRFLCTLVLLTEHSSELPALEAALAHVDPGHFLHKTPVAALACGEGQSSLVHGSLDMDPPLEWLVEKLKNGGEHNREEAEETLRKFQAEQRQSHRLLGARSAKMPGTWSLLSVIAVAYLMQQSDSSFSEFGINQGARVFENGEYWRLFTSIFIHGPIFHLAMNGLALHSMGSLVERFSGPWKLWVLFILSGLGGSLLSALLNSTEVTSLGASGAVLGLAGTLLSLHWKRPKGVPVDLAERIYGSLKKPILLLFAVGIGLTMTQSRILMDNWAHLGGFAMGFVLPLILPSLLQKSR